jgi:thiol-disulfide isomerase/thioredoxin
MVLGGVLLAAALGVAAAQPADKVTLRQVKYGELSKLIRGHKGKVVVVDFWASWCAPCKREFPNLVRLHKKYASEGLVAMSVTLDRADDKAARQSAEKFLQKQRATFQNLLLDAPPEEWQKRLKADGPPVVFVFNRDNRIVKRWPVVNAEGKTVEDVDYAAVEKLVADLLRQK